MKHYILIILSIIFITTGCCSYRELQKELAIYKEYYQGAEELLDTLDNRYGWVDAYDNDHYYEALTKLNTIKK